MENNTKTEEEKNMLNGFRRMVIRSYITGYTLKKLRRKTPRIGYGINMDTPLDDLPYKLVKKIYSHYKEYLDDKRKFNKKVDKIVNSMTKTIKKESSKLNTLRSKMETIEESITDPDTLYIKYQKSGDTSGTQVSDVEKFAPGEVFVSNADPVKYGMIGGGNNVDGSSQASAISNPVGKGSSVSISEGVYFISGCFTYVPSSTLILDKYTNNPSNIIGLQVTESIVTSGTDATLVDNAQGVPNTSAPGANRYQISTTLIKEPIDIS